MTLTKSPLAHLGLSSESFAASGLMVSRKEDAEPEAIFTGIVVHS